MLDYRDGRRGDGCNHPAQPDAGHGQLLPHSESAHVKIISDEERNRLIADASRLASACLREACERGRPVTIIDWSTGRAAAYSDNVIPFPLAKRVGHVAQVAMDGEAIVARLPTKTSMKEMPGFLGAPGLTSIIS